MENVQYTFVNNDGNLVFRSSINSFGLDHLTDKDITSFYTTFSKSAYFDTGLLPVDGSGILSIRTAGNHTQIAYQHAPGMYYINWGKYENDSEAKKYYIAQPYRIVIADLLDGNIYGARTFYSPIPITHPSVPLYHVNFPNINCKGYRGNGVGWICLYHNEDISSYPFNEKVAKILDRCSGTEAYNDNNMSETDGPTFYRDNNKPLHFTDPQEWENYSDTNGYQWTLNPDSWIPVLVMDRDNQEKHYYNGQPLTFADAIIGDYKVYYHDNTIPKPVNRIARPDYTLDSSLVFTWFKQAYNASILSQSSIDPYSTSLSVRENLSVAPPVFVVDQSDEEHDDDDDEDEEEWYCEKCSETYTYGECSPNKVHGSSFICDDCVNEHYTFIPEESLYYVTDFCLWLEASQRYVHIPSVVYNVHYRKCEICDTGIHFTHEEFNTFIPENSTQCVNCVNSPEPF